MLTDQENYPLLGGGKWDSAPLAQGPGGVHCQEHFFTGIRGGNKRMFPGVDSGREAERLSLIRESNLWGTFNGFGALKGIDTRSPQWWLVQLVRNILA